jgi:integrase
MRSVDVPGRGKGMRPGRIKSRLRTLRAALNWTVGQKRLPRCPRFPAVKVPKKKPQSVPTEIFERLLAKAGDAQTRAYLLAGWLAVLRLSEAFELEWKPSEEWPWIDLSRDRVILPVAFAKADEDQWVPLDPQL